MLSFVFASSSKTESDPLCKDRRHSPRNCDNHIPDCSTLRAIQVHYQYLLTRIPRADVLSALTRTTLASLWARESIKSIRGCGEFASGSAVKLPLMRRDGALGSRIFVPRRRLLPPLAKRDAAQSNISQRVRACRLTAHVRVYCERYLLLLFFFF
jgi:hypothetical protein